MEKIYNGFRKGNIWLQKIEMFCGCTCLAALFVIMIVNAALRYLFSSGINWSDELNGFLFVWFGFLAAAYCMSNNTHLNVSALVNMFPRVLQYVIRTLLNLIMLIMFLVYMKPLFAVMKTVPISNVMRIPMYYVYLVLPLSFGAMCYHIVMNVLEDTVQFFGLFKKKEVENL